MRIRNAASRRSERGYSLPEMLVVVAIIGLISLVGVPSFISMQRSMKVKSSLRQFTADVRGARQRAVTQYRRVAVSFETGAGKNSYVIREFTGLDGGGNEVWQTVTTRELDDSVYLATSTFTDLSSPADGTKDVVFRNNGSLQPLAVEPSEYQVTLRTDWDLPYNQFKIQVSPSGTIKSIGSHF